MAVIQLKPERERKPGPYKAKRKCSDCGCFLRTCNPGPMCDPCSTGGSEPGQADVFERIAAMPDPRNRRKAFDAYAEIEERKAA